MVSPTVIALLVTVGLVTGLAIVAWRYRMEQGAKVFTLLQVGAVVWVALTTVGLRTPPGRLRIRIWGVTTGLSLLVVVLWFAFILSYTGRDRWLRPGRLGPVALPLVLGAGVYVFAPTWTPLARELSQARIAAGTVVSSSIGVVGLALGAYVYLIFLLGLMVVVKTVVEGPRLFVGQAMAFVAGSLVTIVASFLVILEYPIPGYPLTQVALGGQAMLWAYAVLGQRFLRVVPAVAEIGERAVLENLDDGVLVVDERETVVRANPQARSYLDHTDVTGGSVERLLAEMNATAVEDLPTRFERDGRTFQADASRVRNWREQPIGHAIVIREITPLVTREQRLAVLNRILRHNVRNDMNVVLGISEQLSVHDDEEIASLGGPLRRTAQNLTAISEKAMEIDQMFENPSDDDRVHLPTMVEGVVSPFFEEYPEATIDVSADDETVQTDARILTGILTEIVENALQHTGDSPAVNVEAVREGGNISVTVSDDGPGIPEMEIESVTGGEQSPVHHAASIGLWFVYWGAQVLGGTVTLSASDDGSEVTLSIPVTPSADHAPEGAAPRRSAMWQHDHE
jgi:signal transduction histidine kinase